MTTRTAVAARDDQVAALVRDHGPATTGELWAASGHKGQRFPPWYYTDLYASLRRLEAARRVTAVRTGDRRNGVLWYVPTGTDGPRP